MKRAVQLASLALVSLSLHSPQVAGAASKRLMSAPDFSFFPVDARLSTNAEAPEQDPQQSKPVQDCRAHIASIVCLDPAAGGETSDPAQSPRCARGSERYVPAFQTLHDQFPPALQRMFCSLTTIAIVSRFDGTAYAGVNTDKDGKTHGAAMGIRRSVLDEGLNLQTWASWKEQLSFGGKADGYEVSEALPQVWTTTPQPGVNDFLYFVVAHEFGHMFDFASGFNRSVDCKKEGEDRACPMAKGTWGELSWETDRNPRQRNRFPFRKALCFYLCGDEAMTRAAAPDLYEGLARSEFLSTYAATNPSDDFADSLAYYLMRERLGTEYVLHTAQGQAYDIMAKIDAPQFHAKRAFLEAFLARGDIAYP